MAARRKNKQKPAVVSGPVEIPDAEHELVIERVAAIDVAKAAGKVCVRRPGGAATVGWGRAHDRQQSACGEHLIEAGIEKVIESTSDYWRIWYYLLEAAGCRAAGQRPPRRNVPGRPRPTC